MDIPDSLPAQLYLLCYDPRRRRVVTNHRSPYLLQAAALTELLLRGRLADDGGRVRVVRDDPVGDPVLDDVLLRVAGSRPHRWRHWISRDGRATARAVLDALESGGWVRVERRRTLLLLTRSEVRVRDARVPKRLATRVSGALTGPLSRVGEQQAALVALAAAGEVRTALPKAKLRAYEERVARLTERSGRAAPELRKAIRNLHASADG
ncbi:GOLPH3/VPS74 family protein [Nonomuraea pusilla]|uniref:Golgi phosphoprotein 3 (GPP34) n=1 Tax=Nonomuraea pusilla TaxID=46177 RepID=A0A1H7R4W1_9ACTN|nr:GPP34 family phosphoprotein [Nonomuraea pusilla]SEL55162.1 Golgi phosphoprotein 3 (GPP34) [Nonomuraea pusilla]